MEDHKTVLFIDADALGKGPDELGSLLMRNFLFTLKDSRQPPWRIIFVNSGVKLATAGSPCLDTLRELEAGGAEILSCGTCLDYYGLKEALVAGRPSNMKEILASLLEASKILKV